MTRVLGRAYELAIGVVGRAPRDGPAHPFGLGDGDPLAWRVSPDVRDELLLAVGMPQLVSVPDRDRLLGFALTVDATLPPNTMLLEPLP